MACVCCILSEILRCLFGAYSGQTDTLDVARWSHMLRELQIVGPANGRGEVLYQCDGADVAATPLGEREAIEIFQHFCGGGEALRFDDESFVDALDAVAQRRYPLTAQGDLGEEGEPFGLLLGEVEEHVIALQ